MHLSSLLSLPMAGRFAAGAGRTAARRGTVALAFLSTCLAPGIAYAEPRPGGAHLPFLWLIAIAGAVACGALPWLLRKRAQSTRPLWVFWLLSLALGILFLATIGSLIVGLGSIIITGRTM